MILGDRLRSKIIKVADLIDSGMPLRSACTQIGISTYLFRTHAEKVGVLIHTTPESSDEAFMEAQRLVHIGMRVMDACERAKISTRTFYRKRSGGYSEREIKNALGKIFGNAESQKKAETFTNLLLKHLDENRLISSRETS